MIKGAVEGVVVGGFKLSAGWKSGKDQLFELVLSYFALLVWDEEIAAVMIAVAAQYVLDIQDFKGDARTGYDDWQ